MFTRLSTKEYTAVSDLAGTFTNHQAVVEAVIYGREGGSIFVDRKNQPTCFLIHENEGFFFLHGSPDDAFLSGMSSYLFDELQAECIEIILADSKLESLIPKVYRNKPHKVFQRVVLHPVDPDKVPPVPSLSPGSSNVIENSDESLTVRLQIGQQTICECRAILGNRQFEIAIKTEEEYRRKGYATFASRKLIRLGLERGLTPVWSCWSFNEASLRLSDKLSFRENSRVNVYLWDVYN